MNREEETINKYVDEILNKELGYKFWASDLFDIDKKDDEYYKSLNAFKFLFNKDDKCMTYLWNELWYYAISMEIDINDFSKEEVLFVNSIKNYYLENTKKYGSNYTCNKNINKSIETENLILKPYDSDLNKLYLNYFKENQQEFVNYYYADYDDNYAKRLCSQDDSKLAFAIFLKKDNIFIGSIALNMLRSNCVYNLEYYIIPEYRKKGYAFEASSKLISMAKNKELIILEETIKKGVYKESFVDIKCIELKINTINEASIKLAKKLNFIYSGKMLYCYQYKNNNYDGYIYDYLI